MDPRFVTPLNHQEAPLVSGSGQRKQYGAEFLDLLAALKAANNMRVADRLIPGTLPFVVTPEPVKELFFTICSYFDFPPEVKYVALEVFDRFVNRHFIALRQHVMASSKNPRVVKNHWEMTSKRAFRQALLRVMSSIQIASKVVFQPKSLPLKAVQKYLSDSGHAYSMRSIYQSEIRVFKMLDFKIPTASPLTYIATLLEGLQYWADVEEFLPICEKVLDFTVLLHDEIYLRLFWMSTGRWERNKKERVQFLSAELNTLLQASAVIVSALHLRQTNHIKPKRATEILSEMTDIETKDIEGLAIVISQTILGGRVIDFS